MPDISTLEIKYWPDILFKITNIAHIVGVIFVIAIMTFFIIRTVTSPNSRDLRFRIIIPISMLVPIYILYFMNYLFMIPYADVVVKVTPNDEIRKEYMDNSKDFIIKNDEYYFKKTIELSCSEKNGISDKEKETELLNNKIVNKIKNSVTKAKFKDKKDSF